MPLILLCTTIINIKLKFLDSILGTRNQIIIKTFFINIREIYRNLSASNSRMLYINSI